MNPRSREVLHAIVEAYIASLPQPSKPPFA
jgi:hypothetical protein